MAEDKKSFILYADLISVVKKLVERDRQNNTNYAGELFLHILEYVNDNNPIPIDFIVEMAFEPIKLQLKRDLVKWIDFREKQSFNGKKGGRPKKDMDNLDNEINPKNPTLLNETQKSLNVSDTVIVTDSVSVKSLYTQPQQILGIDYIIPYSQTSDSFRQRYDEDFYNSWISINKYLNENCIYLRSWEQSAQLTIVQYKSIYDRIIESKYNIEQCKQALSDLDGSKPAKEKYNSIYHGFNIFIKTILKSQYV